MALECLPVRAGRRLRRDSLAEALNRPGLLP